MLSPRGRRRYTISISSISISFPPDSRCPGPVAVLEPSKHHRSRHPASPAPFAQHDDQVGDQGGVLARALDQRQPVLGAVDVDAEATSVLTEAPRPPSAPPRSNPDSSARAARPGRSRPARRTGTTPPSGRWRLRPARCAPRPAEPDRVAPGRQAGEHPVQCHPAEDLGVGEQLVGRYRELTRAVGRAPLQPLDRHPTPTQGHRAALVAVPHRHPVDHGGHGGRTSRSHPLP